MTTPLPLADQTLQSFREGLDSLDTLFRSEPIATEDLSLCFMCLRWTTGDEDCRRGHRCDLQKALDLGAEPCPATTLPRQ